MSEYQKRMRLYNGRKRWHELVLKFITELKNDGYEYDEIAKITKLTESTVRTLTMKQTRDTEMSEA